MTEHKHTIKDLVDDIGQLVAARAQSPKADFPFESHFLDVYDATFHYVDEGPRDTDPIVFLHGNPTWTYLWRNVIPALATRRRCIAPDLIGMGRSLPKGDVRFLEQTRYFEGFIAELGVSNLTMVVHDWGSAVGLHFAMRHPAAVRAAVLMEAMMRPYPSWDEFPRRGAPREFVELFHAFRGPHGEALLVDDPNGFVKFLMGPTGRPLTQQELAYYREPFVTRESRLLIKRWTNEIPVAGEPPDVADSVRAYSEALQASRYPKLLLYSDAGVITTETEAEWARGALQQLTVQRLEFPVDRPAHFMQEVAPGLIADAVAKWLESL